MSGRAGEYRRGRQIDSEVDARLQQHTMKTALIAVLNQFESLQKGIASAGLTDQPST